MSVPVRYSAAASYAVVDTLQEQQEEHYQQQQLFAQAAAAYNQQYNNNSNCNNNYNNISSSDLSYEQQQLQQQQLEQQQQQQFMQQQTALTASILPFANMSNNNNNKQKAVVGNSPRKTIVASSSSALNHMKRDMSMSQQTTLANAANNGNNVNATALQPEWMMLSEEAGYGTPGAAGLEYQKCEQHQQQQQQQQPCVVNNNLADSSLTDNENNTNNNINNNNMTKLETELNALTYDELYNTLKEYDALQEKYHTVLLLPKESRREVTAGGRDGSAYVLRCLKMWYELPSDVLFSAMSLVDRFLDRMAVKPKHMACMSVASFHLAIKQLELKPIPADDLVTISQCGCTAGDLERMAGVIANKLGVQMGHAPITSVSFLRIYYALFRNLAKEIGGAFFEFYQRFIKLEELENRLENLLCDVKTTVITPSTLALVLICLHLDFHIKESYTKGSPELKHVFEYILFLQQYMNIPDRVFTCGFTIVSGILSHYNGQNKQPYKQRLVWKLSSRTLRVLRPINRFSSDLPTIEEGISNAMDDGLRSRTESISSEEEEDWPTSPIIPIFEQC